MVLGQVVVELLAIDLIYLLKDHPFNVALWVPLSPDPYGCLHAIACDVQVSASIITSWPQGAFEILIGIVGIDEVLRLRIPFAIVSLAFHDLLLQVDERCFFDSLERCLFSVKFGLT